MRVCGTIALILCTCTFVVSPSVEQNWCSRFAHIRKQNEFVYFYFEALASRDGCQFDAINCLVIDDHHESIFVHWTFEYVNKSTACKTKLFLSIEMIELKIGQIKSNQIISMLYDLGNSFFLSQLVRLNVTCVSHSIALFTYSHHISVTFYRAEPSIDSIPIKCHGNMDARNDLIEAHKMHYTNSMLQSELLCCSNCTAWIIELFANSKKTVQCNLNQSCQQNRKVYNISVLCVMINDRFTSSN